MPRVITIQIDLDELPAMIQESAQTCFAAHRIQLAIDGCVLPFEDVARYMREMGNNTAGVLALHEVDKPCEICGVVYPQEHDHRKHNLPPIGGKL